MALSGLGAEPCLAPSPPESPFENRDILDTLTVADDLCGAASGDLVCALSKYHSGDHQQWTALGAVLWGMTFDDWLAGRGTSLPPDAIVSMDQRIDSALDSVGDALSWFQEQRAALSRHEYDEANPVGESGRSAGCRLCGCDPCLDGPGVRGAVGHKASVDASSGALCAEGRGAVPGAYCDRDCCVEFANPAAWSSANVVSMAEYRTPSA